MGEPAGGRLFPYIRMGRLMSGKTYHVHPADTRSYNTQDETGELYRREVGIIWAESM